MKEKNQFSFLINRLLKECKNSRDYVGVDYSSIEGSTDQIKIELLFESILDEMNVLSGHDSNDYVETEYDRYDGEYKPFRTENNLKQHVNRLDKFIKKYAPKYLDSEIANDLIRQSNEYTN